MTPTSYQSRFNQCRRDFGTVAQILVGDLGSEFLATVLRGIGIFTMLVSEQILMNKPQRAPVE